MQRKTKKNVLTVLGNFLYCKHEKLQFALLSVFLCFLLKCLMFKAMFANVEFFEFGLENEISSNTLGIPYKHETWKRAICIYSLCFWYCCLPFWFWVHVGLMLNFSFELKIVICLKRNDISHKCKFPNCCVVAFKNLVLLVHCSWAKPKDIPFKCKTWRSIL